jgi:hypothetical protein
MLGRPHVVDHDGIPAACFTHPEIAFVGLTEEKAAAKAKAEGFTLGKSVSYFKANSKALAELEIRLMAVGLFGRLSLRLALPDQDLALQLIPSPSPRGGMLVLGTEVSAP